MKLEEYLNNKLTFINYNGRKCRCKSLRLWNKNKGKT